MQKTLRVLVLSVLLSCGTAAQSQETQTDKTGDSAVWNLPMDALYFTATADEAWNAINQERIMLKHGLLRRPDSEEKRAALRTETFNDIKTFLKPEWQPLGEWLKIGLNGATSAYTPVFYGSYSRAGCNVVVWGETGKRLWMYVEQPQNTPATSLMQARQVLNATPFEFKGDKPLCALDVRALTRFRRLKTEDKGEAVRILLIRITQPNAITLSFPTYFNF